MLSTLTVNTHLFALTLTHGILITKIRASHLAMTKQNILLKQRQISENFYENARRRRKTKKPQQHKAASNLKNHNQLINSRPVIFLLGFVVFDIMDTVDTAESLEKIGETREVTFVILKPPKTKEWNSMALIILNLPNYHIWNVRMTL